METNLYIIIPLTLVKTRGFVCEEFVYPALCRTRRCMQSFLAIGLVIKAGNQSKVRKKNTFASMILVRIRPELTIFRSVIKFTSL